MATREDLAALVDAGYAPSSVLDAEIVTTGGCAPPVVVGRLPEAARPVPGLALGDAGDPGVPRR